jgi:hypothetical protein
MFLKKWLVFCTGLVMIGLLVFADGGFAQGRGRGGGNCPRYGTQSGGGGGQWQNQQGRGPGNATCPYYAQRTCDGTGPKGRTAGPRSGQGGQAPVQPGQTQ